MEIQREDNMNPSKLFGKDTSILGDIYPNLRKIAMHSCVIEETWIEGQAVPGFEVPKDCMKAKAVIHDVRLNPMNCRLQALFIIHMIYGANGCKFEGWV
jgi:hypothetical protein